MKNTFKFSYLTPTPDTLANIALCRWNDALKGLPAFIQIYMQSQHFLQGFGFSRALSYKEYLNKKITKDTDLKVYVGGYEINLSELLVDHDLDLVKISSGALNLVTFFRITFETEEVLLDSNFISHDGTSIPVTEQNITITVELCYSDSTNWNFETQKPLSDLRGNTASALFDMENDDNSDGLYGRDCTLWTTPTEKTIYGYKWQCALPISFLMPDNLSVSNIYFDRQSGEFEALYTVPVVKRFFQNIEKAIYDTHLLNCLHDYNKTEEEIDENNNEYIVVGGVNLDENTENLYPVAEDNDHLQIKIAEINSHITEIDTNIEEISNDITTINSRMVTTHSINSETVGDNQEIFGEKSFKNSSKFWAKTDFINDINVNIYRGQGYTPIKTGIINDGDYGGIAVRGCCDVGDNVIEFWRDNDDNDNDNQLLMWINYVQSSGNTTWDTFKTTFNTTVEAPYLNVDYLKCTNNKDSITIASNVMPSVSNGPRIGTLDNKFGMVCGETVVAGLVRPGSASEASTSSIGTQDRRWYNYYGDNMNLLGNLSVANIAASSQITANTVQTGSLNATNATISNSMQCNTITGVSTLDVNTTLNSSGITNIFKFGTFPHLGISGTSIRMPVGGIAVVIPKHLYNTDYVRCSWRYIHGKTYAGNEFVLVDPDTNNPRLYISTLDYSTADRAATGEAPTLEFLPGGRYVFLSNAVDDSSASSLGHPALVQRIG